MRVGWGTNSCAFFSSVVSVASTLFSAVVVGAFSAGATVVVSVSAVFLASFLLLLALCLVCLVFVRPLL